MENERVLLIDFLVDKFEDGGDDGDGRRREEDAGFIDDDDEDNSIGVVGF